MDRKMQALRVQASRAKVSLLPEQEEMMCRVSGLAAEFTNRGSKTGIAMLHELMATREKPEEDFFPIISKIYEEYSEKFVEEFGEPHTPFTVKELEKSLASTLAA